MTTLLVASSLIAMGAIGQEVPDIDQPRELPAFTDDAEVTEPDYFEVVSDARKIADQIEERLIKDHMSDAGERLFETNGVQGHPKVFEAYQDMEEMIRFCQSTGGKGGSACKFKLQLKMNLNPGNTLGQLKQGMMPGQGIGTGLGGKAGQGEGGGGATFGLFGPESPSGRPKPSSRIGPKKVRNAISAPGAPDPLAGNIEELLASKDLDLEFDAEGDEQVMEEYRRLVEQYFKRLAQEE